MKMENVDGLTGKRRSLGNLKSKDKKRILRYRWEFLRRNKSYQDDFKTCFGKRLFGDYGPFKGIDFNSRYGINPPVNPKYVFEDLFKIADTSGDEISAQDSATMASVLQSLFLIENDVWAGKFRTGIVPVWNSGLIDSDLVMEIDENKLGVYRKDKRVYKLSREERSKRDIFIEVNLDAPKKQILNQVVLLVKEWKRLVGVKDKNVPRGKGAHIPYDRYLRIWDLRTSTNLSWSQIGRKVGFKGDVHSRRVHAINNYKEAVRLIVGGYREIK